MNTLFVDDSTERWQDFSAIAGKMGWNAAWAIDYNAATNGFGYREYDIVFLDHDLGEGKMTGYDVAKFMVQHGINCKFVVIHTMNPVGAENINTLLRNTGYRTFRMSGCWNDEKLMQSLNGVIAGIEDLNNGP